MLWFGVVSLALPQVLTAGNALGERICNSFFFLLLMLISLVVVVVVVVVVCCCCICETNCFVRVSSENLKC